MEDLAEKVVLVVGEEEPSFWRCASCGTSDNAPQDSLKCRSCSEALFPKRTEGNFIGSIVGERYEILEEIGCGAWGMVYKARQVDLDRVVAIKVLKQHLASDRGKLARFRQEALAVSKLVHGNITQIFDYGIMDNRQPYFVMEYLEGQTLSDFVKQSSTLEPSILLKLFLQVLAALGYAHLQGIIHRDLKPDNVLILKNADGTHTAKLLDFGIARREDDISTNNLTATGELLGTPLYMSPEQCLGDEVDARSDLYSFACVIFECLSGVSPFLADNSFNCMMAQINQPPPLLHLKSGAVADDATQSFIRKALNKDKSARFQSATEMAAALETLSITACAPPSGSNRRGAVLIVTSVLLLAGLVCAFWLQLGGDKSQTPVEGTQKSFVPPSAVSPVSPAPVETPGLAPSREEDGWEPLLEPDSLPESSTEKLKRCLAELKDCAAELTRTGQGTTAGAFTQAIKEAESVLKTKRFDESQKNGLDLVRVQDGRRTAKFDSENTEGVIDVTAKGYDVELLLCGNVRNWKVNLAPGVRLKAVWKWSDYNCTVQGIPAGIPVKNFLSPDDYQQSFVQPQAMDSYEMPFLLKSLAQRGFRLSTAQFLSGKDYQCTVGPESLEWLSARMLSKLKPLIAKAEMTQLDRLKEEVGKEKFWGIYHAMPPEPATIDNRPNVFTAKHFISKFDFTGPIEGQMFPCGDVHTVTGSGTPNLFAQANNGLVTVNTLLRATTPLKAPPDIPDPKQSNQIAYDAIGKKLLCLGTFTESYDVLTKKWKVLSEFRSGTVNGLAFDPAQRVFYALPEANNMNGAVRNLYKLDMQGKVLRKIALSRPVAAYTQDGAMNQLYLVKNYLVVVTVPVVSSKLMFSPKMCVVEPETGKVLYYNDLIVHR
jgi:serine/threonine protein kinase